GGFDFMEKVVVNEKEYAQRRKNKVEDRTNIISKEVIVLSMEETKGELDRLRNSFNFVSDPRLIESIIYKERDAMARYEYLIEQARKQGIKVGYLYIYNNACTRY
ncbi:MAG: DUF2508 family protein, partial [Sarcina sp.]